MDITFNPGCYIGQGGMCFRFNCINHPSNLNRIGKCRNCIRINGKDTNFEEIKVKKNMKKSYKKKRG